MATKDTVEAYFAAWNEADEGKRRRLLDKCWADKGTYTDPLADVTGKDALIALIDGFHKQMPGAGLALNSAIDEHHGRVRFGWQVTNGPQPMDGIDVCKLTADGQLESVVGFWGLAPAAG